MPYLKSDLWDMRGACVFGSLDYCSGYWQLAPAENSQSLYPFITADGVVQPTKTIPGGCNSAANFQAKVGSFFAELQATFSPGWTILFYTVTPSMYTWTIWKHFSLFALILIWLFRLLRLFSIPSQ